MTSAIVTDSMRAYARVLLSKSAKWAQGFDKQRGIAYVSFVSSRTDRDGNPIYHKTCRDGSGCTCPGYLHRGICSHALACQWEADEARERMTRRRPTYDELMDAHLVDAF